MSLISTEVILSTRTPEKRKGIFMCKGTCFVGVYCNSIYVLIKLLPQIEECIFLLFIVGSGCTHMHKELLIQGVCACPFIPPVSLRWAVFYLCCGLIKPFELNIYNFLCPVERDRVCIRSYIPTKICHSETVMFSLLNQKINVL